MGINLSQVGQVIGTMQIGNHQSRVEKRRSIPFSVSLVLMLGFSSIAQGDIFLLKAGGQVTGVIIDRGKQGEYVVESAQGAVVSLSRKQVERVIPQDKVDLQYAEKSLAMPDTVEAHRKMVAWCKENRLNKLAKHHLQRVIELDPSDEQARKSLGYQRLKGRWMTRDEIMAARGMRKYAGDYRTPQDIALRERVKQREQAETDWLRQIRTWVGWLDKRRSAEAAQLISAVRDPHAAVGIAKLLEGEENQRIRDLLTATLAGLKHPVAVTTLVDFSLYEPDPEVRLECLEYLLDFHQPLSLSPYIKSLDPRKHDNEIVNRAAEALGRIGDPEAISPLIDALVTTHNFKNPNAPIGNMGASFSPRGGGGTGGGGGGLSMGGNKNKVIRRDLQNLKVRQALVELSGGQDYEFDEKLWRMWFVNQQIPDYVDARRDQ